MILNWKTHKLKILKIVTYLITLVVTLVLCFINIVRFL